MGRTQATDITTSSEDLMARIAEGDEDAFEVLVNRHQIPILNFIYRFVGNRAQAKDLAQEVFRLSGNNFVRGGRRS